MPSCGEQTGNLVTFVYAAEAKEIPHYTFLDDQLTVVRRKFSIATDTALKLFKKQLQHESEIDNEAWPFIGELSKCYPIIIYIRDHPSKSQCAIKRVTGPQENVPGDGGKVEDGHLQPRLDRTLNVPTKKRRGGKNRVVNLNARHRSPLSFPHMPSPEPEEESDGSAASFFWHCVSKNERSLVESGPGNKIRCPECIAKGYYCRKQQGKTAVSCYECRRDMTKCSFVRRHKQGRRMLDC